MRELTAPGGARAGLERSAPERSVTPEALAAALREVGVTPGATAFVHADLDRLGPVTGCGTVAERDAAVLQVIRDLLGDHGTLVVPSYSFSFCRREPFDVARTPAAPGPWSPTTSFLEQVRGLPGALRSRDPIHSVVAVGPGATALVADLPPTCFGPDSVFARLRALDAVICLIGLPLEEATFRHHVEEACEVPFRYRKLFTGRIRDGHVERRTGWVYSVRIRAANGIPDGSRLEPAARRAGVCRSARAGGATVLGVRADEYFDFVAARLREDPWYTAAGPATDPVAAEDARVGARRPAVALPPGATMTQMVDALWRLPRDLVSDGYDAALEALAAQVPMKVHRFPSGTECWTWIVPEKWTCLEARLERLNGEVIVSREDHPLHVVSYSLPFEGVVSRDTLFEHLHVHPVLDDAIPFVFKYYERDWGLCTTRRCRDALRDDRYRVVIRADDSLGELKVGEVVVPGELEDSVVLCVHLCHPGMVNDDLTGVVVGVDVMRVLAARPRPRYTWRFLILPETIGSLAWLSRHEALIPRIRGGLFLEMLGRDRPHALQLSFAGDTVFDRCWSAALRARESSAWTGAFRSIIGNDERQFNAPGVRVPMLSLSRVERPGTIEWPYREYHSSHDTPDRVPPGALEESRDMVLHLIEAIEREAIPVNRFRGEVFCSRFGLHVDPYANPEGHRRLFDIMFLVDGTRSAADLARECGVSEAAVRQVLDELRRHGLVG